MIEGDTVSVVDPETVASAEPLDEGDAVELYDAVVDVVEDCVAELDDDTEIVGVVVTVDRIELVCDTEVVIEEDAVTEAL